MEWRNYWDGKIGTVRPEDTYRVALKTYLRNPDKRMIVWFLQPHYPFIDRRFSHINALGREFMNKALLYNAPTSNLLVLVKIAKSLLRKGYLCAGIPGKVCEYAHRTPSEAIKAYIANLLSVLYYEKLTEVLPGKIVITSDHGEAFGEPLNKLALSLRVYGHPSRIRVPSLTQVPYLIVENNISRYEAVRKASRHLIHFSTTQTKGGDVQR
ncbi:MAG: hypothetical protein DRN53_00525 [Thermoprotei archaeon]|nr:MAG: hypothetical protein DRN53_00525 [Thermoprotei archaeon]